MRKVSTKKITSIGGSALIEGIMMRGPKRTTVCVRTGENEIYSEDIKMTTIPEKCKLFKLLNTTNVHFEAGFIVTFCKDTFAFEFLIKQGLQMFVTFLRTKNVNNVLVCEFRNIY